MSGNTYVTVVYASAPLNLRLSPNRPPRQENCHFFNVREHICNGRLRLSPPDRGRIATLRKMQSPVAFQRRLARPRCNVPYFEGFVPGCRDDSLAVGRPIDRRDSITAIFLMSGNTYVTVVYASPPDRGRHATLRKMRSPVALEHLELLARSHIPQPDAVVVLTISPAARSEHGAVERESDAVDLGTVLVL